MHHQDIEKLYLTQGLAYETASERAFTRLYNCEPDGGHYRLLCHSNKICLITLAPLHPIIIENLKISSINYQANPNCNRQMNKVIGKKKSGAQFLSNCSILCTIICEGKKEPFTVRSNLVSKLIEMNEEIVNDPNLIKDPEIGFIAVMFPKLNEVDRELQRWISEKEYLKTHENKSSGL